MITFVLRIMSPLDWSKRVPGKTSWEGFVIVRERGDDGFVQSTGGMNSKGTQEIDEAGFRYSVQVVVRAKVGSRMSFILVLVTVIGAMEPRERTRL